MKYSIEEKLAILRQVAASGESVRKTLERLGVPRGTFYRWSELYGIPIASKLDQEAAAREPAVQEPA